MPDPPPAPVLPPPSTVGDATAYPLVWEQYLVGAYIAHSGVGGQPCEVIIIGEGSVTQQVWPGHETYPFVLNARGYTVAQPITCLRCDRQFQITGSQLYLL